MPTKKKIKVVSRKAKPQAKAKKKKAKVVQAEVSATVGDHPKEPGTLSAWADIIMKPTTATPPISVHAADKVDINSVPIDELMNLAARECSCVRLQRSKGVKDPICTGECSHAKALEELGDRGIVA